MKINDAQHEKLKSLANSARGLFEGGDHREALDRLTVARERAEMTLGFTPGYIAWCQARCAETLGDMEGALNFIGEALTTDAFNLDFHQTFLAVTVALRYHLEDPKLDASDPSIPRIYAALTLAGETNVGCHIALARHHLKVGNKEDARALIEAVNLLAPTSVDAWRMRVNVARAFGDEPLALKCEEEATLRTNPTVPFAIVGRHAEA